MLHFDRVRVLRLVLGLGVLLLLAGCSRADLRTEELIEEGLTEGRAHQVRRLGDDRFVEGDGLVGPGGGLENLRWTLDRQDDLAFCQAVFAAMGERAATAGAAELARLCLMRPDLVAINARWHDSARVDPARQAEIQSAPVSLAA